MTERQLTWEDYLEEYCDGIDPAVIWGVFKDDFWNKKHPVETWDNKEKAESRAAFLSDSETRYFVKSLKVGN